MSESKIIKNEIGFLKKIFFVLPFIMALFVFILIIEFNGYRDSDWSSFKERFQENELNKLDAYKEDGYIFISEQMRFRTALIPTVYSSLFKGEYTNLFAHVGIDPLNIYQDARISMFEEEMGGFNSMFFIFCIIVIMYGLSGKSSLSDLSELFEKNGKKKLFLFLSAIRIAIITSFFLIIMIVSVIIGAIFGVKIFGPLLIAYSFVAILTVILSFSIGTMFSFAKSNGEFVFTTVLLIIIFLIIPNINSIGNEEIDSIINKRLNEFGANQVFFEKTLEAGEKFQNKKIEPGRLEKFLNDFSETYYKKIDETESKKIEEMKKISRHEQIIDSFSPISFYGSVCAELSNGKKNRISLYQKAKNFKKSYLTWNLKRRILGNKNTEIKLEPFLKKDSDENILYAAPSLPDGFVIGLFSTIFYILVFALIAYRNCLKNYLNVNDSENEPEQVKD